MIKKTVITIILLLNVANILQARCCVKDDNGNFIDNCPNQMQMQACVGSNGVKGSNPAFNGKIVPSTGLCATCGHLPIAHNCDQSGNQLNYNQYPVMAGSPVTCPN